LARDTRGEFRDLGATAASIMGAVSVGGTHYIDAVTQGTWYDADAPEVTEALLHQRLRLGRLVRTIAVAQRLLLEPQAR
jgi:hypothetical protein